MEYGLIGEKLGHSYSKIIHEHLLDEYKYEIHPIEKDKLDAFMKEKNFKAINVTIPYKRDVIPYLDEIDEKAKKIGAVNTLINKDGYLIGKNTDYDGFVYLLERHHINLVNKKILVMGNGGASKAIQAVLKDYACKEIILVDINLEVGVITLDEVYEKHLDVEVIINTTPIGMYPKSDYTPLDLTLFKSVKYCVDVIYNPLNTKFIREAKALNIIAVGGLEMLVAQAKKALEHFKDIKIDDTENDRIYKELLKETSNLIFIGMPGSGKSTISKIVAKKLNKKCIDIDEEIVNKIKMPISKYFELYGEDAFRDVESEICKEVSMLNNIVISTGGGIIKRKENVSALKQNGVLILLERDINLMYFDKSRPLSSNKEATLKLYEERKHFYLDAQDSIIKNESNSKIVSEKAIEAYLSVLDTY